MCIFLKKHKKVVIIVSVISAVLLAITIGIVIWLTTRKTSSSETTTTEEVSIPFDRGSDPKFPFKLSVGHVNDIHSRFDETSPISGHCKENKKNCIGGMARMYTVYKQIKNAENFILLNAGDVYQGSILFTLFNWNITQLFMNMFDFHVHTLGNHEFDNNVDGVVPLIKTLRAPMVVANIDDSSEPTMQKLYNKSTIIIVNGLKIGIIGVLTTSLGAISSAGKLKMLNEIDSINKEAQRLVKEENVFTNIVISHCGYLEEKKFAEQTGPKVSLIVGGHSHSLLYTGRPPCNGTPVGDYPTVVKNKYGDTVLVVQAEAYTKYFGNISIVYDKNGKITSWEGAPIYLGNHIDQDLNIVKELQPWKEHVKKYSKRELGVSLVELSSAECSMGECALGNFLADAMIAAWKDFKDKEDGAWTFVALAAAHTGGIRAPIQKGIITYNDILTTLPFSNTYDFGNLQGKYIRAFLEHPSRTYAKNLLQSKERRHVAMPQLSGIKVVVDYNKPYGERVTSLKVLCQNCSEPVYEDLNDQKMYRIVVTSFMTRGGDGFVAVSNNLKDLEIGIMDVDFLLKYIPTVSPINPVVGGRITVIKPKPKNVG